MNPHKGPSIKDVRSQGEFVQFGHFANKGGSSDADVRTFWNKKHRIFKIYGVFARARGGRGWASEDIMRTRGEGGQFFEIFCGRLLWTAPKLSVVVSP